MKLSTLTDCVIVGSERAASSL